MKILIVYATFSNGTAIACQVAAEEMTKMQHSVTIKKVQETDPQEFLAYDLIVMASPSWMVNGKEGQPHDDYFEAKTKFTPEVFKGKKFAVMGLGDATYAHFCGAVDFLEGWIRELSGELVTPSLRVDGFYFDQVKNTQLVRDWAEHLASRFQHS